MANRLAAATSPYLLQHADNPVDWWEWGDEAFAEARRRDVPVLLSVGYAACHWCHVMAHESFQDEQVAAALADGFVAIKVDREERPDVDAIYMTATTALTGQGGWPMTVLMTAEGEPFWAGTYLPRGAFLALLASAREAWRSRRAEVDDSSARIAEAVRAAVAPTPPQPITEQTCTVALQRLAGSFDRVNGGFGRAPKFPPSMVLEFLLRHHARTGSAAALAMVDATCTAMARGGMYDQLGGGFARYAVDAEWVVPHFEKMLYDNALLARVYGHLWRATGSALAERIARETCDLIVRDLGTREGGFAASLDADTEGVEGLTYAWSPAELVEVLGAEDGSRAAALLEVTEAGTFEHGRSTLQLRSDPDDPEWWAHTRGRLLKARGRRPQPARDDKVVTAWNGLAIAALADVGALLGHPAYVANACTAAELVMTRHLVDGRLRRASRDGVVGSALAVADDHGDLAEGLLALHQATGAARWLAAAGELLDSALERYAAGDGAFHDTPDDGERLVARPHSAADNAEPSGQSALAGALLTYGALTGSPRHLAAADAALEVAGSIAEREPRFAGWTLAVAEARLAGPLQVAVVGTGERAAQLLRVARASAAPGLVAVAGEPDAPGLPLLEGRPLVDGKPAAYVCRGFVCERPITDPERLRVALATGDP
ncbi:MAG TPA: thioredoxin domain-containing protein [Dermatophilaceae bacterium]|nr:thioredoxin domain-containing protein [Dermatophilaceae bacterium]